MPPRKNTASPAQTENPKPTRVRVVTPFDEAKSAQSKLEALELKRQTVLSELSAEAKVMLEALDELRAKQSVAVEPAEVEEPA